MPEELDDELARGRAAAEALIDHMRAMGASMLTNIVKSDDGEDYLVIVGLKSDFKEGTGAREMLEGAFESPDEDRPRRRGNGRPTG